MPTDVLYLKGKIKFKSYTMATILSNKPYDEESVFRPENLLREARRQNIRKSATFPKYACWIQMETLRNIY